jgi:2-polyprenyl-3-methyl-5-hydroxy-6-metoxy-1,4-benzoquinol methylase
MSNDDGHAISARWSQFRAETDLEEYHARWRRLEATGVSPHGEADFIDSLQPRSVLDAGCGMGRVAIELAKRGVDVVGVDLDDDLLEFARRSQPSIHWVLGDLATMQLGRLFHVVAMTGNVMVFCRPADRAAIVGNAAAHLESDGLLVAGFQLESGPDALDLDHYDELCSRAGLRIQERWSTWNRQRFSGDAYAVSVHRREGLGT